MPDAPSDKLRQLKEKIGLGFREAGRRAGLSHTQISQLEKGDRNWSGVSVENAKAIARAYGLGLELVCYVNGDMPEPQLLSGYKLAPLVGVAATGRTNDYPVPSPV